LKNFLLINDKSKEKESNSFETNEGIKENKFL